MNDVDENGAVKPGLGLYLLGFFLSRQLFYAPLSLLASRRGRGQKGGGNDLDLSFLVVTTPWEFFACLPGALMLFLMVKNKREAGERLRSLWLKGQTILFLGVLMQVAAQLYYYLAVGGQPSAVGLALGVGYLYALVFIFTNSRVKDSFMNVPVS